MSAATSQFTLTAKAEELLARAGKTASKSDVVRQLLPIGNKIKNEAPPSIETVLSLPGRRPLMPFKTLTWSLYRDEDFVLALIGNRKLIAFNIAAPDAGKSHTVVWLKSILDYLANRPPTRASDETILADIFPGPQTSFPTGYLAQLFTCSRDHIKNLIDADALEADPNRPFAPGRGKTRHILRHSVVTFLKNGRVS